jgi:hypothetical protein
VGVIAPVKLVPLHPQIAFAGQSCRPAVFLFTMVSFRDHLSRPVQSIDGLLQIRFTAASRPHEETRGSGEADLKRV